MGRIRYLAVICRDPASLADFYANEIGMEEMGRSPEGDVSLTDGCSSDSASRTIYDYCDPNCSIAP